MGTYVSQQSCVSVHSKVGDQIHACMHLVSNLRVDRRAALSRNIGFNVSAPKASDKLYDATLVLIYTSAHRMNHYFSTAKHLHHTRARRRPVTFRCNRSPDEAGLRRPVTSGCNRSPPSAH